MSSIAPTTPELCPRCANRRIIERSPGARLQDDRPDLITCPKCFGTGPVTITPEILTLVEEHIAQPAPTPWYEVRVVRCRECYATHKPYYDESLPSACEHCADDERAGEVA